MNRLKLTCEECGAPVTGEDRELCAHCGSDAECGGCGRGEVWAPGCWYLDGEHYVCEFCGSVHVASADGESASLSLLDPEVQP